MQDPLQLSPESLNTATNLQNSNANSGGFLSNIFGTGNGGGLTGQYDGSGNAIRADGSTFGQKAQIGLGAIQTLGSLWNSFQQNKLAKKSLGLQTRAFETNLANQTKTYNTALEDRINARYATEGRSDQAAAKIAEQRL